MIYLVISGSSTGDVNECERRIDDGRIYIEDEKHRQSRGTKAVKGDKFVFESFFSLFHSR